MAKIHLDYNCLKDAIQNNDNKEFSRLISLVENVNYVPLEAGTPLISLAYHKDNTKMVKDLLDHGADVNSFSTPPYPRKLLSDAIIMNKVEMVRIFLEYEPDIKSCPHFRKCTQRARKEGYKEVVEIVENKMKELEENKEKTPSKTVKVDQKEKIKQNDGLKRDL